MNPSNFAMESCALALRNMPSTQTAPVL